MPGADPGLSRPGTGWVSIAPGRTLPREETGDVCQAGRSPL